MEQNIYDYIKTEETRYNIAIPVMDNWDWNMKDHIHQSLMLKHGKFISQTNDLKTKQPFRNIVYPLLNLRYKAEDIDLTDVVLYVNDETNYHLSFLIKKYHDEVYVREHDLDTFFDETLEEKIDLGGTLVRKGKDGPIYEPLDSIAFCDQSSILSGPIGFKLFFSPDELYDMESLGWGKESNGATVTLDELVTLAEQAKTQDPSKPRKTDTPGKYIEVYRVHGSLPASWLKDSDQKKLKDEKYVRQMHVVAFYKSDQGLDQGVTLYRAREYENPFKLHLSGKKLRNRALAYGGVEELFDPQIWTNYSEIRKKDLIDALSKVIRWTDDQNFEGRNKLSDLENNEMLVLQKGSQAGTFETPTANVALMNEWMVEWDKLSQTTSGATDALLGKAPAAGTPFRLEALVTQQGQGLHDRRRGKYATFIAEIYDDWIIPAIKRDIIDGAKFLATLSADEMEYVASCLARNTVNRENTERVLTGELPMTEEEKQMRMQQVRDEFAQGGNKRFLEILKGEFDDMNIGVKVNVAGKQKDLAGVVEKMTNIFRQVFANPAILQDPRAVKVFNKIIEYSGMEPIDFGYVTQQPQNMAQQSPEMTQQQPQPALPANQPG